MTTLYSARWVLPVSSSPIVDGALAIEEAAIVGVGSYAELARRYPEAERRSYGEAAILPGFINAHSHLELTAMRGFLDSVERDFFSWLRRLTVARLEHMTANDLQASATWGACEALRAGVTCVADASDSAAESMKALRETGLRGTVYQESFGPDPKFASENFAKLTEKVSRLKTLQTSLVQVGVSPHAPYTVSAPQLEMISEFALAGRLPVMMHAAESVAERMLLAEGSGSFAEGFASRGIEWSAPSVSTIRYLARHGILQTQPLLAHCINVDADDLDLIGETQTRIAHCPKSNAKLGHGRAPFAEFLRRKLSVGLGSDSVASNNTCDLLEEARFALLLARAVDGPNNLSASDALHAATLGGARALGLEGVVGELREGCQADFAVVSLAGTHQLPSYDPVSCLIFSSSGRDVLLTVVAGKELYREGSLAGVDEERLRARMNEIKVGLDQ
ncbi:MAG TPA: amidohydrolase family protein [Pyrinomonadaceae bacterium]|nr:amidohydrolase family protein [Pyrinomonadaceae bacterium]